MIFEGVVNSEKEISVPDTREELRIYTDADITVAYWMHLQNQWGPEIEIESPGNFVAVCGNLLRVTGTADIVVC